MSPVTHPRPRGAARPVPPAARRAALASVVLGASVTAAAFVAVYLVTGAAAELVHGWIR